MLPTFLVIGAMRAGTTTLYRLLRSHPDVFMPETKEPNYFGGNWERGREWYEKNFDRAGNARARGEASTGYSHAVAHPHAVDRIADTIPHVRLVYLLRHPIERIISQYHYATINRSIETDIDRAALSQGFLTRSMYAFQIDRYLERFDRKQLLILMTDELRDHQSATLARTYEFIGVDPMWTPDTTHVFHKREDVRPHRRAVAALRRSPLRRLWVAALPGSARRKIRALTTQTPAADPRALTISEETRARVLERLRPDLARLREILGADFHCWGLLDADASPE